MQIERLREIEIGGQLLAQIDTQICRWVEKQRYSQVHKYIDGGQIYRQAITWIDRQIESWMNRYMDRQIDTQMNKQKGRQISRYVGR